MQGGSAPRGFKGVAMLLGESAPAIPLEEQATNRPPAATPPTSPGRSSSSAGVRATDRSTARAAESRTRAAAGRSPRSRTRFWKNAIGLALVAAVAVVAYLGSTRENLPATSKDPWRWLSEGDPTPGSPPAASLPRAQPKYLKPGAGNSLPLTVAEIRYCLAEDIRLEAGRTLASTLTSDQIMVFNSFVDDFNRTCSQFRYRASDMALARADVERERVTLTAEGRSRFR